MINAGARGEGMETLDRSRATAPVRPVRHTIAVTAEARDLHQPPTGLDRPP